MLLKEISNKLLTYRNKDLVLLTKYLSNISCLSEVEKNNCFVLANKNTSITKMFNEKTFKRKMCFSRRNAKKKLVNVEIRTWYKIWTSKNKQILTEKKRKKKKNMAAKKNLYCWKWKWVYMSLGNLNLGNQHACPLLHRRLYPLLLSSKATIQTRETHGELFPNCRWTDREIKIGRDGKTQ